MSGTFASDPTLSQTDTVAVVVVCVVAVVVAISAFSALLFLSAVARPFYSGTPGDTPIGTTFAGGDPTTGTCTSSMVAARAWETVGDFTFNVSIEQSYVNFGGIGFQIDAASGAVYHNLGVAGFAVVNGTGQVAAYSVISASQGMTMTEGWNGYGAGYSGGTELTTLLPVVIDMGQSPSLSGQGLTFVAFGVGAYSGTTNPLPFL